MDLKTLQAFRNEPVSDPWKDDVGRRELPGGIERAKTFLHQNHRILIDDRWIDGAAGTYTNVNPNHRDEKYGPFSIATPAQAEEALAHAKRLQAGWARSSYRERADVLRRIRKRFAEEKWTIMGLLMCEIGKTGIEAYAEWAEAVDFLDYYANASEIYHTPEFLAVASLDRHATRLVAKPLGIGVSLPPFNFANAIFTGMCAAPTVMGNVCVVKPSPRAPASGIFATRLFQECGLPVQLVLEGHTNQNQIGEMLVRHPDIAFITFTGSRVGGFAINRAAAETSERWIKRVVAEMGGCDFIAVHDMANLDAVLDAVQTSALGFQGQKCSALSRLIIRTDIYDRVKEAVVSRLDALEPTDVTDPTSAFGGVIDERAHQTILAQCERVRQHGGRFLAGGMEATGYAGFGILPGVHEGLDPRSDGASEEIFGPVFGLYKAKDFDELVAIANSTPYALTGSLFTNDPALKARAHEFTSGNTYINRKCTGAFVGAEPFGGWYASGTDDKAGHWSHLLRFIQLQTISEKIS